MLIQLLARAVVLLLRHSSVDVKLQAERARLIEAIERSPEYSKE
jgi:hypothetical protein